MWPGTGRTLRQLRAACLVFSLVGLDLSTAYLREANALPCPSLPE